MAKIIIHTGYPKTATTWFSRAYYPFVQNYRFFSPESLFKSLADRTLSDSQLAIIQSNNSIILDPELIGIVRFSWKEGALQRKLAENLRFYFPGAHIVVFIRNQLDFLLSAYAYYVRKGGTYSIHQMLDSMKDGKLGISLDFLDYYSSISLYRSMFGNDNVHVFLYEDMKEDPAKFLNDYAAEFQFDVSSDILMYKPVNKMLNDGLLKFYLKTNKYTRKETPIKKYRFHIPGLYSLLNKNYATLNRMKVWGKSKTSVLHLEAEAIAGIRQFYAESNQKLIDEFGMTDIARYDYPLPGELNFPASDGVSGAKPDYQPLSSEIIRKFNKTRTAKASQHLCNAPFRNMYIAPDGSVYPCCYNQTVCMGNVMKQSIEEIWDGAEIRKLRDYIAGNDLNYGCHECRKALENSMFDAAHISFYDSHFKLSDKPTFMEFQIDNTCNLECIMCTGDLSSRILCNREKRKSVNVVSIDSFTMQIEPWLKNLAFALFSGGEPFLINSYYEIWEALTKQNPECNILIQTNGSVLNDRIKAMLEDGNFSIGISLDSLNETTYEEIRNNAKLQVALHNITYFRDYAHRNKRFIGISTCPMQQNWREMPDIANYCIENRMSLHFNTVWFPGKCALWLLPAPQLREICEFLEQHSPVVSDKETNVKESYANLIGMIRRWVKISEKWEEYTPVFVEHEPIQELETKIIEAVSASLSTMFDNNQKSVGENTHEMLADIRSAFDLIEDTDLKMKSLQVIAKYRPEKLIANIFREDRDSLALIIRNIYKLPEM